MSRIAVIDALFNWPPDGGARTDIKQIAARLSLDHHLAMFVPDFTWFFPRGRITGDVGFHVKRIPFNPVNFNWYSLSRKFRKQVEAFKPDYVLVADAWNLKPHLVNALSDYPVYIREYAYESSCFRLIAFDGTGMCRQTFMSDRKRCLRCAIGWLLNNHPLCHLHEFLISVGFTKHYVDKTLRGLMQAEGIIVYNELAAARFSGINERVHVVPGGIDPQLFEPLPKPASNDECCSILMVGRAGEYSKGFHVLHEACCKLWEDGFHFDLLCTGGRKGVCGEKVRNIGWLPQEKLPGLYARSDICVVPSIWPEAFGIVALEAMACGKPVIVSRVGGLQNIINDGIEGFVVDPGSPEQLKDRLSILLKDPKLRKQMGEAGRKRVLENYTWDIIYDRYYAPLFA